MSVARSSSERDRIRERALTDAGFAKDSYAAPRRPKRKATRDADRQKRRTEANEARYYTITIEQARAAEYAQGYAGNFPYMVKMRARAIRFGAHWTPTDRETTAILNCYEHDRRVKETRP